MKKTCSVKCFRDICVFLAGSRMKKRILTIIFATRAYMFVIDNVTTRELINSRVCFVFNLLMPRLNVDDEL